ncbi:UNVERIFIED_CONTAM: hypothetical protein Sangu_0694700 [Sesamum angustifolium]|uniref:Uncharacterized protein n=1 Tax=Sesamum angustifolium TaxID=2727405 RepID=A0AAW2PR85_9LAMI
MAKSTTLYPCPPTLRNQTLTLPCTCKQQRRSALHSAAIRAAQDNSGRPPRLIDIIRIIPETSKDYFKKPSRRVLFGGISLLGGFYIAQTVSLSFGALGVNDVISAVVCVLMAEYATRFYYSRQKVFSCYSSQHFQAGIYLWSLSRCI